MADAARVTPGVRPPCGFIVSAAGSFMALPFREMRTVPFGSPPTSIQPREAVRAPALAAHPVVEEEETVAIVFVLHRAKACVVLPPEGVLPVRLEEVGLPHIRRDARQEFTNFIHRRGYDRC